MTTIVMAEDPRRVLARRLVMEAAILDLLAARYAATREQGEATWKGTEATVAETTGEQPVTLGRVYREKDRESAWVNDEAAQLEWALVNRPDQVETEEVHVVTAEGVAWLLEHHPEFVTTQERHQLYPAWTRALLAAVRKVKGWPHGEWTDPVTGEERTGMPGWLSYTRKPGNLVVKPGDDADAYVAALLAEKLPELEA